MFVVDKENPTGMFSKAGRLSIEMFALLQEKEAIMTNKRKTFNVKHQVQGVEKKKAAKIKLAKMKSESDFHKKIKTKAQPFTKTVSREYLDNLEEKIKNNNQKFGMYHPKFHYIFEKSPFYEDQKFVSEVKENVLEHHRKIFGKQIKTKKPKDKLSPLRLLQKSQSSQQLTTLEPMNDSITHYKEFGSDMKHGFKFSRISKKKPFYEDGKTLCEKRFQFLELPQIFSKVQKPRNIYFEKAGKGKSVFQLPTSGLQYDVNMDSIYPKSPKLVTKFDNSIVRKTFDKPIYTLDESICETSMYQKNEQNSQILKKIHGPIFEKMITRNQAIKSHINTSLSYDQKETSMSMKQQTSRFQ